MKTDAISLYARPSANFDEHLSQALDLLGGAVRQHPDIVQANSLGAEDLVVTHLLHMLKLPVDAFVLDTGVLHAETLGMVDTIAKRYGSAPRVMKPVAESVITFVSQNGERAMYDSLALRKACCAVRKLEPLERALSGRSAWITGLRREQSDARAEVNLADVGTAGHRSKFNPLANWTWGDVWHFIATHDVPINPLHDQRFPSIGCAPCTRAITLGEDLRAGRWWWEQAGLKECGLHVEPLPA